MGPVTISRIKPCFKKTEGLFATQEYCNVECWSKDQQINILLTKSTEQLMHETLELRQRKASNYSGPFFGVVDVNASMMSDLDLTKLV
ncbi:hypothetical protein Trydic_g847 [Trypoxylus dichotomus]